MKKAQILGQPFVFLFYAVVAVLILFFGAKLIGDFMNLSSDVEVKDFAIKFRDKVTDVYYDNAGSVVSFSNLNVPSDIREICVIDFSKNPDFGVIENQGFEDLMKLKSNNTKENLFLYGENIEGKFESVYVENLLIDSGKNPVCSIVQGGKVSLKAKNSGRYVEVIKETA